MADSRKEYAVVIGGVPHTLLLDADGAERYGVSGQKAEAPEVKQAPAPKNKARSADNK